MAAVPEEILEQEQQYYSDVESFVDSIDDVSIEITSLLSGEDSVRTCDIASLQEELSGVSGLSNHVFAFQDGSVSTSEDPLFESVSLSNEIAVEKTRTNAEANMDPHDVEEEADVAKQVTDTYNCRCCNSRMLCLFRCFSSLKKQQKF